jgi:hypothetical protein
MMTDLILGGPWAGLKARRYVRKARRYVLSSSAKTSRAWRNESTPAGTPA